MSTEAPTSFDINDAAEQPENGVAGQPVERAPKSPAPHRRRVESRAPHRPAEAPPLDHDEAQASRAGKNGLSDEQQAKLAWPVQPGPLWATILDWIPTQRIGDRDATVDDVMINVERISGAGQTGSATFPEPIAGIAVQGDDSEPPDAALLRVLTDTYHVPIADKRSRGTYRMTFYWRHGNKGTIKKSEPITLDSPENIAKMRLAQGANTREVETLDPAITTTWDGKPLPSGIPPEILLELGAHRANEARREGKPVAPAAFAPAPAPTVDFAAQIAAERKLAEMQLEAARQLSTMQLEAEREKAKLQAQIDAMKQQSQMDAIQRQLEELRTAKNAAPAPDVATIVAQTMFAQLQALGLIEVGPDGQARRVGAGTPPVAPPPAAQSAEELAQRIVSHRKSADEAAAVLATALGLEPRNTARAVVQEEEEEEEEEASLWGKISKSLVDNLDVIATGGLHVVGHLADAVLVPNVANTVKAAATAATEQLQRKAAGRAIPGMGGSGGPTKPPSV